MQEEFFYPINLRGKYHQLLKFHAVRLTGENKKLTSKSKALEYILDTFHKSFQKSEKTNRKIKSK